MGTILVVDDDAQLRHSFEKLLTSEAHTVRTAATGEAGLESVKTKIPDLVIMDVRLPAWTDWRHFRPCMRSSRNSR